MAIRTIRTMGDDVLRKKRKEVTEITKREITLINDMVDTMFEANGVGLAAPQVNVSKRMTAVLVPSADPESDVPELKAVLYNPKILSHSVQEACLSEGEGCLSVDHDVPGYVPRPARITLTYFNEEGEKQKIRLKNYSAIVVQHELDHLNGIMFYDHINEQNPFALKEGILVIE